MEAETIIPISTAAVAATAASILLWFNSRKQKIQKRRYAIEFKPATETESATYRYGIPGPSYNIDQLLSVPQSGVKTIYELLEYSASKYPNNNCVGSRPLIKIHNEEKEITKNVGGVPVKEKRTWTFYESGPFQWTSFVDFRKKVLALGSSFITKVGLKPKDRIGIFANTCPEWFLTHHAAASQSIAVVTVYANLGEEGLAHAINESELTCLFTSSDLLKSVANIASKCPTLKTVFYVPDPTSPVSEPSCNLNFYSIQDLIQEGSKNPVPPTPPSPDDIMTIMYTSGTTGAPKGVVLTHRNLIAIVAVGFYMVEIRSSDVYAAFLPLAHVLELIIENALIMGGAALGYCNARTLVDSAMRNSYGDLHELAPTLMAGVPVIWDRIRKGAMDKLASAPPSAKTAFNIAFNLKRKMLEYGIYSVPGIDVVFSQFKKMVGGRLRLLVSGGAPISEETQTFLRICFSCNCLQGYGLTETCGVVTLQPIEHNATNRVGVPVPAIEVKLVDIPEMGYTHKDHPRPRGEIVVRGPTVAQGYFKNEKATSEVFSSDGWFSTGDVGEMHPDGTLAVIDRKKNLVKLSGGEYIALERIEAVSKTSHYVENICVYGDSFRDSAVAVVVPSRKHVEEFAAKSGIEEHDYKKLLEKKEIKQLVLQGILDVSRKEKLKTFETVQNVHLTDEEWTPENDMLTAAMKLKRRNIYEKYKEQIAKLHDRSL